MAALVCAALSGCATYHALPLPTRPDLAPNAASGSGPESSAVVPLRLSAQQAVELAVKRDPDLAAMHAQVQVAQAQAYDAGLLPDPALALSLDHPFNGGAPSDHHTAWSANLAEGLVALITHADLHSAASAHYAETLLSWRWQVEQVALKARLTYLNAWSAGREVRSLQAENRAAQGVLAAAGKAHAAGALAAVLYQQALTHAASVRSRLQSAADREVQAQSTLATLLRVQAGQAWQLEAPAATGAPDAQTVDAALAGLPKRRLDLLALQAGYKSADAKLRAAILAQFPILDIGFTRSRDNTGVNMVGFGITLRLPIFNGNRGQIAIDRATRAALNAAYQAHLDSAANDVRTSFERLQLAARELAAVKRELPALGQAAGAAEQALVQGDVTRFDAFAVRSAWLDARINADQLRATTAQLAYTLQTLLALPVASAAKPPATVSNAKLNAGQTKNLLPIERNTR
ncbi:MAG: TolC family protein [Gammaproteobacteria bacterium]